MNSDPKQSKQSKQNEQNEQNDSSLSSNASDTHDKGYFNYYGLLTHQQNMLQDHVRTSAYHRAIVQSGPRLIKDRIVMDVGAGSGILSYFAAAAGASKVYAVEASNMALKMRTLLDAAKPDAGDRRNPWLHNKIEVVAARIEDKELLESVPKVDVIISEPIGVLLVHERMIESFIHARDVFLKPGGALLPADGRIQLAPFTDVRLWHETMAKTQFWNTGSFYDVDLTPLSKMAFEEYFSMPVVGAFNPRSIMTNALAPSAADEGYYIDFHTVTMDQLREFTIPINWTIGYTGIMHGISGWFDIGFGQASAAATMEGAMEPVNLSTSPAQPVTHWQQVRFLFSEPLAVNAGQKLTGSFVCKVNAHRSYDIDAKISVDGSDATRSGKWYLQDQTYDYSYTQGVTPEVPLDMVPLYPTADVMTAPVPPTVGPQGAGNPNGVPNANFGFAPPEYQMQHQLF
ncbi:S-adenosyl-L-methionine-dependent methyltransferase [Ramicandelaber brevisporus]|nr:S-adenosyl-L-methionine-dependent methyltransferase [Ramicandelaber brevisporus]